MDGLLWLLPVLGCGLMMVMMVVMMFGMGKDKLSRTKEKPTSVDELRAQQKRLAEQIDRLDGEGAATRDREPSGVS